MTVLEKRKEGIKWGVIFLISLGMMLALINIHESLYQTSKDLFFGITVLFSLLLLAVVNGVDYRKISTWIEMGVCVAGAVAYILIKDIRPATYGVNYSKVVYARVIVWALFVFLLFSQINKDTWDRVRLRFSVPYFWLTLLICILIAFWGENYLPMVCPVFLLLILKIDNETWGKMCDCLALAYYFGFVFFFSRSLIAAPFEYDITGRYIGIFLNNSRFTALCGGAVITSLYFFIKWLRSGKDRCL